jgi:hypothetical protein
MWKVSKYASVCATLMPCGSKDYFQLILHGLACLQGKTVASELQDSSYMILRKNRPSVGTSEDYRLLSRRNIAGCPSWIIYLSGFRTNRRLYRPPSTRCCVRSLDARPSALFTVEA